MHRTIAIPLSRDSLFPYARRGWEDEDLIQIPLRLIDFIHRRPYLEKGIEPHVIAGRGQSAGIDFLREVGATAETKPFDFLAEQLLLVVSEKEKKLLATEWGNIFVKGGKQIKRLDFRSKSISYTHESNPEVSLSAPMPDDIWNREEIVPDLGVRWWSILRAVGAAAENVEVGLQSAGTLIKERLFEVLLEKANIALKGISFPSSIPFQVLIDVYEGNERVIVNNKHEDEYKIDVRYIKMEDLYLSVGNIRNMPEDYEFLVTRSYGSVDAGFYFRPDSNTGVFNLDDSFFVYEGVMVVGDRVRILLGKDVFLGVQRDEEDEDELRFTLILDTSRKVKGLSEVWVEESHGALLFKKMTGRDISL